MDVRVHIGRSAGRFTPSTTDIIMVKMNSNLADLLPKNKQQQFQYIMVYIYYGIYLAAMGFWILQEKVGISFYF